jgi:hypothetical protein
VNVGQDTTWQQQSHHNSNGTEHRGQCLKLGTLCNGILEDAKQITQ